MQPTVLAGAIEFSPAEIAFILLVIALSALTLSAPGWVVLAYVAQRRAAVAGASRGGRTWAGIGGALLGMAASAAAAALVGAVLDGLDNPVPLMVLTSWVACWGVALMIRARPDATAKGWGR